jgi:glycosyltransferase involved in cell wall biosynthesis
MRVLLLATRDPRGRTTGRKVVLRSIVRVLRALGHSVVVLAVDQEADDPDDGLRDVHVRHVARPGLVRLGLNLVNRFLAGHSSLNECVYYSPRVLRTVRKVVALERPDVVVADMIRTAQYAELAGVPWIVDLDDLLSVRYRAFVTRRGPRRLLLGYYGAGLPRLLRMMATVLASALLRVEGRRVEQREVYYARRAGAVSLVNPDEVESLSRASGRKVHWLPMTIPVPEHPLEVSGTRSLLMVFVGGIDFQPNFDAVRYFAKELYPAMQAVGLGGMHLTVVGSNPARAQAVLQSPGLRFVGYVRDLESQFRAHNVFVAPIVSGSGIKTKVLEAMAWGMPVLGTDEALRGIGAVPGREFIRFRSADEFVRALRQLMTCPERGAEVGAAGRSLVLGRFELGVVAGRWEAAIAEALALPAAGARQSGVDARRPPTPGEGD